MLLAKEQVNRPEISGHTAMVGEMPANALERKRSKIGFDPRGSLPQHL